MEIKAVLNPLKKIFDRILLTFMALVLIVFSLKYINLLRARSEPFGDKELYALVGIPVRSRADMMEENVFREWVDKKVNFVLGIKPAVFYDRLVHRNPFIPLKDLVIKPFSLEPVTLTIRVGEKSPFQTLHGIGPYKWECEPDDIGVFEDNVFEARTHGQGRIIATDARGKRATAELEIVVKESPLVVARPRDTGKIIFRYKGPMTMKTASGEEAFAFIEDSRTGRFYTKKIGEEIGGFIVKGITQEKLVLFDKAKGKEIELIYE